MNEVIYYNTTQLRNTKLDIPGIDNWLSMQQLVNQQNGLVDRTDTIVFPLRTKVFTPLPNFELPFIKTYEDCAMQRMCELDEIYKSTGKSFRLFYSGGVDTTGIFAAFVGYYGIEKTSKILELCCSREAIVENPWLWERYISKYNFKLLSSHNHNYLWNDSNVISLQGETNDHLLIARGSLSRWIIYSKGDTFKQIDKDIFYSFFQSQYGMSDLVISLLEKVLNKAPFELTTMPQIYWWLTMSLSYDAMMLQSLSGNANGHLKEVDLTNGFPLFFKTIDFEKCSAYYVQTRSKELMATYKYPTKDLIKKYLNIPEYDVKGKHHSFGRIQSLIKTGVLIDSSLEIKYNLTDFMDYMEPNNSFV